MREHNRDLASAFMHMAPANREAIGRLLGIGDDLPDTHPAATFLILDRVRELGLHDQLREALTRAGRFATGLVA